MSYTRWPSLVGATLASPSARFGKKGDASVAPTKRSGFTLIEVLATMVLLAIVLPATMRAASIALAAASSARHVTEATALGEAKLNELVALNEWSQNTGGDFGADNPAYRWSIENVAREYGVYDVRISVTWSESGKERKLMLSTLAYSSTGSTEGLP